MKKEWKKEAKEDTIDVLSKLQKKKRIKKIKIGTSIVIGLILIGIIVFIGISLYTYFKIAEPGLNVGANIEQAVVSLDGGIVYIKLAGGSNVEEITKIKFIFTDSAGEEYVYETAEGVVEISVPYDKSFWDWLFEKTPYEGVYDYDVSAAEIGLYNYENIEEVSVSFEYKTGEGEVVETEVLDTATNKTITRTSNGGGNGYTPPPSCTPDKTCNNYPNQCGSSLSDGCSNSLDCSNNCDVNQTYCYIGEGVSDVCVNNSLICVDSDNGLDYYFKGNVSIDALFSEDNCLNSNVTEYYCYYNETEFEARNISFECSDGCFDGACEVPQCTANENCTALSLPEIATCTNPVFDGIDVTWDSAPANESVCLGGFCTTSTQTITSSCDKVRCLAECELGETELQGVYYCSNNNLYEYNYTCSSNCQFEDDLDLNNDLLEDDCVRTCLPDGCYGIKYNDYDNSTDSCVSNACLPEPANCQTPISSVCEIDCGASCEPGSCSGELVCNTQTCVCEGQECTSHATCTSLYGSDYYCDSAGVCQNKFSSGQDCSGGTYPVWNNINPGFVCLGYCYPDYDGGEFCVSNVNSCAHDGVEYNNGQLAPDCLDTSQERTCSSGSWTAGSLCDDSAYCNGVEICSLGSCQAGTPVNCDDGISCTADSCNEGSDDCDNIPNDNLCDDGKECTTDSCDSVLDCVNTPVPERTVCSGGICNLTGDCVECIDDSDCDTTAGETCQDNVCVPFTPQQCSDCGLFGWFCDEIECHNLGDCYYDDQPWPLPNDCTDLTTACLSINSCSEYSNEECNNYLCSGIGPCEFNISSGNCEEKVVSGNFYYVTSIGTGNQDGSDWNNAFAGLPGPLERSYTYYIADGTYSGYTFNDPASGTQYITIKKATINEHGTNDGWQLSYANQAVFGDIDFSSSYVIFDGVDKGFKIEHVGVGGVTVSIENSDYITFKNSEVDGGASGNGDGACHIISMSDSSYITIENSNLHDAADDGIQAHNNDHLYIIGNEIHTLYGDGSTGCQAHSDAIELFYIDNAEFKRNLIYDIRGNSAFFLGGYPSCSNIILENNIFYTPESGFVAYIQQADGVKVYNNIFWGGIYGGVAFGMTDLLNIDVYNNIFHSVNFDHMGGGSNYDPVEHRFGYNLIAVTGQGEPSFGSDTIIDSGFRFRDVPEIGGETFRQVAAEDFNLQAGSPAINVGYSGIDVPQTDYFGNSRFSDVAPDMGAIEYFIETCTSDLDCPPDNFPCLDYYCDVGETDRCLTVDTDGTLCNDANECTDPDTCSGRSCGGIPLADDTPCTDDFLFCTGNETCQSGFCTGSGDPCSALETCIEPDICQAVSFPADYISYYRFEGNANDETGRNNGIPSGIEFTLDSGSLTASFDNANDYVEIGTNNWLANSGTLSLWVNVNSFSRRMYMFGHTSQPAYGDRIQLYFDSAGDSAFDLGLGNTNTLNTDIYGLNINEWYHISLEWDNGNYVVYVNGTEEASGTYSGLTTLSTYADIGNDGNSGARSEGFDGLIDNVMIYNRSLESAEILQIYNDQIRVQVPCTLTNAYWQPAGPVDNGTSVELIVQGTGSCSGEALTFEIYEDDGALPDDYVTTLNNNYDRTSWIAEWQSDWGGIISYS